MTTTSTTQSARDLKPCPFCGGKPELVLHAPERWVRCLECKASGDALSNELWVIERWNTRAMPAIPDDDADFTPDLARKIIAKYQEMLLATPAAGYEAGEIATLLKQRPDSLYNEHHLDNWTADDFARHTGTTIKTVRWLLKLESELKSLAALPVQGTRNSEGGVEASRHATSSNVPVGATSGSGGVAPAPSEAIPVGRDVEPVAWILPGDDNARADGSIDAMAWQEGEFSRPLYAHPVKAVSTPLVLGGDDIQTKSHNESSGHALGPESKSGIDASIILQRVQEELRSMFLAEHSRFGAIQADKNADDVRRSWCGGRVSGIAAVRIIIQRQIESLAPSEDRRAQPELSGHDGSEAKSEWRTPVTVADLVSNLLTLDQSMQAFGVYFIDRENGDKEARPRNLSLSLERVVEGRIKSTSDAPYSLAIWSSQDERQVQGGAA